jgi:hypothetical protein
MYFNVIFLRMCTVIDHNGVRVWKEVKVPHEMKSSAVTLFFSRHMSLYANYILDYQ